MFAATHQPHSADSSRAGDLSPWQPWPWRHIGESWLPQMARRSHHIREDLLPNERKSKGKPLTQLCIDRQWTEIDEDLEEIDEAQRERVADPELAADLVMHAHSVISKRHGHRTRGHHLSPMTKERLMEVLYVITDCFRSSVRGGCDAYSSWGIVQTGVYEDTGCQVVERILRIQGYCVDLGDGPTDTYSITEPSDATNANMHCVIPHRLTFFSCLSQNMVFEMSKACVTLLCLAFSLLFFCRQETCVSKPYFQIFLLLRLFSKPKNIPNQCFSF